MSAPPYLTHTKPGVNDGIGDMMFLSKYRAAAGNAENGNYVVTAMLAATVPTGTFTNGSTDASLTPTPALGKSWGNFDLKGTCETARITANPRGVEVRRRSLRKSGHGMALAHSSDTLGASEVSLILRLMEASILR